MKKKKRTRIVVGRNVKYNPKFHPERAYELCKKHGYTNQQLADVFGVGYRTITSWKYDYSEFYKAVQEGKDIFDTEKVERALLKRAVGYEYDEHVVEHITLAKEDGTTVKQPTKRRVTNKSTVPSETAMMFWLQNRSNGRWKNTKFVDVTSTSDITETRRYDLSGLSRKDLETLADLIGKADEEIPAKLQGKDNSTSGKKASRAAAAGSSRNGTSREVSRTLH